MASLLIFCALLGGRVSDGVAAAPQPGKVTLMLNAKTAFDPYVTGSTPAQQEWIRETFWMARAYPPFFDRALGWAPPTYFYKDLYAIYADQESRYLQQHPSWFLRDAQGRPLYIPYACAGGTCPQYAADVGNPAWRQHWIDEVKAELEKGYTGVHIDDVNLSMTVGNGNGSAVRPIDPRTGGPMTDAAWRRYVTEFVEEVRAQLPEAFISHNPVWSESESDPFVRREVDAADAIELERGFSDGGLTNGTGTYGFETFMNHIDWLHDRGKSIILQPYSLDTAAKREFEIGSYLLVQEGDDSISSDDATYPDNFWAGWTTDLGAPQGERYKWNGLWRRDFANGMVLVNQPGAATQTVDLGGTLNRLNGDSLTAVTLPARSAAVLKGSDTTPGDDDETGQPLPAPTSTDAAVDRRRAEVTRTIRVLGRVRWVDGGQVELRVRRRGTHHGRTWTRKANASADGSYELSVSKLKRGRYSVAAAFKGTDTAMRSRSKRYKVRVG